jgi:hypothetical protein
MEEEKVKIPQECAQCSRKHTVKERTNFCFQKKAKLLIAASLFAPLPIQGVIGAFLPKANMVLMFSLEVTFLTMLGIVYAYNMPRLLKLRCARCKHTENYIIKVKNKHRLFDDNDKWLN